MSCVRSSVNVTMTSTFVSGPTAQSWQCLQLKQLVNNDTNLSYRASLTAAFNPNWKSFVLLHGACWKIITFGSTSEHLLAITFIGLTALRSQVDISLLCVAYSFTAATAHHSEWSNVEYNKPTLKVQRESLSVLFTEVKFTIAVHF